MDKRPSQRLGTPISLGDLLAAMAHLQPSDADARSAILVALGLDTAEASPAALRVGPWLDHDRPAEPPTSLPAETARPEQKDSKADPAPSLAGSTATLSDAGLATLSPPEWALDPTDPFPAAEGDAESLPPPPLFAATGARAILGAILATRRDGVQLDVERAVESLAKRRLLRRLPMRQASTLRRGAQILVDRADALTPFRTDIDGLLADLARLWTAEHMQVLQFRHCPGRGVRTMTGQRAAWHAAGRGVPVLVISDFGAGTPVEDDDFAEPAEWIAFARRVNEAGCNAVALTPFAPRRWPAQLTRTLTFVHWSERTTARQAARALRESNRVRVRANG